MLSPASPLSQRWYVLSLTTLPPEVVPFADTAPPSLSPGEVTLSRFSVGPSPVIRDVKLASNGTVVVEFSEGVLVNPTRVPLPVNVTTPDHAACTLMPTDFPNLSTQIGFKCSPLAWSGQQVHLEVSPGLAGAGGVPLGVLRDKACAASPLTQTLSVDIDFSNAPGCSSNCKEFSDFVEPDTDPPTLSVSVTPQCLWPPNHSMVLYTFASGISAVAKDACDPSPVVRILDVVSDQPCLGGGSGSTCPDTVSGPNAFCVRSERDGTIGSGRHYAATVEARDAAGNTTRATVAVDVPHNQGSLQCAAVDSARVVPDGDSRCSQ